MAISTPSPTPISMALPTAPPRAPAIRRTAHTAAPSPRTRRRRTRSAVLGTGEAKATALRLGALVRTTRERRRITQDALAERVGVTQGWISRLENGHGGRASLETWFALFSALGLQLRLEVAHDPDEEPVDAGHLKIQELVLRLGRPTGRARSFELHTRPADPRRSTDAGLRDDPHRTLILVECWNTIGNIGEAARSGSRKTAEAEGLAAVIDGDDGPYRVASCWVVRATRRNRALLARYPEVFASRFPGSSLGWVRALTEGTAPPEPPGLVWCDVGATRIFPWRRPRT